MAEATAGWVARLRSDYCSSEEWGEFCQWRDAEAANAECFVSHMEWWTALDNVADAPEIVKLRMEALALDADEGRPRVWYLGLAASVLLIVAVGFASIAGWSGGNSPGADGDLIAATGVAPAGEASQRNAHLADAAPAPLPLEHFVQTYSSAVGQRSRVSLPDGSTMHLNTDTLVEVKYTPQRRELRLVRGEAVFEVASNVSRPFIVNSEGDRVIALGTVFSVKRIGHQVVVSLIEGSVQVERVNRDAAKLDPVQSVRLVPGQQLVSADARSYAVRSANLNEALSWRKGRIVFNRERLSTVVEDLNRYSVRKLRIGDPGLAETHVSGAFRTGSAEDFASALSVALSIDIAVDSHSGDLVLLAKERGSSKK